MQYMLWLVIAVITSASLLLLHFAYAMWGSWKEYVMYVPTAPPIAVFLVAPKEREADAKWKEIHRRAGVVLHRMWTTDQLRYGAPTLD